jgi:glycine cleavage system H protein
MADYPTDLRYTKDHEWLRTREDRWAVGITQFAVDQLGDITLVELPRVGDVIERGARFGTVESVKSVSDLYAPVSGTVVAVNAALADQPELVNQDPHNAWMIELAPSRRAEEAELMTAAQYAAQITAG